MANLLSPLAPIPENPIGIFARGSLESLEEPPTKKSRTEHNCYVCGTTYTESRSLVRHQKSPAHCARVGTAARPLTCSYCNRVFTRNDLRSRHEKEVHFNIKRSAGQSRPSTIGGPLNFSRIHYGNESISSSSSLSPQGTSSENLEVQSTPETEMETGPAHVGLNDDLNDIEMDADLWSQELLVSSTEEQALVTPGFSQPGDLSSSGTESEGIDSDVVSLIPDNGSILSVSTLGSIKSRLLPSTNQQRSALIYKGAAPRPRKHKAQVFCALCNEHLGSNVTEVRAHLEKHSKQLDQDFSCKTCQITFAHERDLTLHETSAAKGECGFVFDHAEPCNGHHPPDIFSEMLTDNDRLQFTVRLQHWEQAQLKMHLAQVNEILQEQSRASMDDDCWSFGGMLNSLVSLSNQDYRVPWANFDTRRKSGNLALAAFLGDTGKIKQMVTRGADINATYPHKRFPNPGFTPLQAAVQGGSFKTLEVVIQLGAITSMKNKSNLLALASCIQNDRIDLARFLLEQETNINDKIEACTSLLNQAVYFERCDMAQMLLDNGADANTPHTLGTGLSIADCTLGFSLPIAVSRGDYDMVQLLLYHGAKVPAEPERSRLLDEAAQTGGVKLVWLLSQYAVNSKFASRRQLSYELEMTSSTDGLVASASSVPAFTKDSRSEVDCLGRLLIHAISLNRFEVVEALLWHGADPNADVYELGYPLQWSIRQGHKKIAELLVNRGARVNNWNGKYPNALACATEFHQKDIALILVEKEADIMLKYR